MELSLRRGLEVSWFYISRVKFPVGWAEVAILFFDPGHF